MQCGEKIEGGKVELKKNKARRKLERKKNKAQVIREGGKILCCAGKKEGGKPRAREKFSVRKIRAREK